MTFRAFSIGFSVAVLALACGSDSGGDGNNGGEEPVPTVREPNRDDCEDNSLLAECQDSLPPVDNNGTPTRPPSDVEEEEDPNDDRPENLARAAVENILAANCGGCHGPALDEEDAEAGMNYIQDLDRLVAEDKIVPGNSNASVIIQKMESGEMPKNLPPVSRQEIDIIRAYIDNPANWDLGEEEVCGDQLVTFDDLYQAVANDLADLDDDDALTARYISLTNRYTAGVCGTALDLERQGLFKLLNSLSIDPTVTQPRPIDDEETIYRIDLEDYQWDRPITVVIDGVATDFVDVWEAIAAQNPYAIEFFGEDADEAKEDANTLFPVMMADSMLDVAAIGNLYYAIIDVDVQDTLDNFIANELLIDVDANLEDEEQVFAGTTRSNISRQDRLVRRDDIGIRSGALYVSLDFEDDAGNDSIFENPFIVQEGGSEAIFTLPNGFFGYIIADADGNILEDSDILLDTKQNNFRAVTMVSCAGCHAGGLFPVRDEVRDIAISNALVSGLNNDDVEQLRNVFPDPAQFASIIEEDTATFFKPALARAGVSIQGIDPLSEVFFRFDQDMRIQDLAGELGVTVEQLEDDLNLLQPELQVLEDSTADRDDVSQFIFDSICKFTTPFENAPDPDLCLQVADNDGIAAGIVANQ